MSGNGNGDDVGKAEITPPPETDVFVLVMGHGDNYTVASNVQPLFAIGMLAGAIVQAATNEGFGMREISHSLNVAWEARKGGGT